MTRQESYIAELSQLLFYMTAWDKAEVLKGITAMINHPETGVQTMEELGTPMKLAVTLHRQYTPTPEPSPEEQERKAAMEEVSEETAELPAVAEEELEHAEEVVTEEADVEEAPEVEEAAEAEEGSEEAEEEPVAEAAEEAAVEEAVEEAVEDVTETVMEEAAEVSEEEAPAEAEEILAEEQAAQEEAEEVSEDTMRTLSLKFEEKVGQEKIFAEIFSAATEAQSAVPFAAEAEKETVRKARYWFLIPYIAFAVVIGVPATLVFALANMAVCAVSLVSLAAVVYLVLFQLLTVAVFSSKLIVLGLTLLMAAVTILLWVMSVWFLRTATVGFPRFLIEVARKYGYREVEVQ